MIKVISQDKYKGEVFDTEIKVDFTITVAGLDYLKFKYELEELVEKYRI